MKAAVDACVPILVFFSMVVVGMEPTVADFRRVARQPGIVVVATLGQFLLLPVIGWFLIRWPGFQPAIARGVLLVAACPSGAMANVYTYLARANVALSVCLTAMSCLIAVFATPVVLAVLQAQAEDATGFPVPLGVLAGQLFILLVLPILLGMGVRRRWPDVTRRYGRTLLAGTIAALLALLAFVIVQEAEYLIHALTEIAVAAALLTVLAFGAGWAAGWGCRAGVADRFTVGMVFVVRNVGIATAIAVTVLGQVEFAVFATAYFLVQAPILLTAALAFRRLPAGAGNDPTGIAA